MTYASSVATALALFVVACAGPSIPKRFPLEITRAPSRLFTGPREVVITGERDFFRATFDDALRARGFRVKRFISMAEVSRAVGAGTVATISDPLTRYVVEVKWGSVAACQNTGILLRDFRMVVTDLRMNEIVLEAYGSKAATEGCRTYVEGDRVLDLTLYEGSVFRDCVKTLDDAWERAAPASSPEPKTKGSSI